MLIKLIDYMKAMKLLKRRYRGVVIDNEDPKKIGRVKCEIKGIYEGAKDDLPWIVCSYSDPQKFDVPEIGQELKIVFPYDDIYSAEYIGFWHNEANHVSDFDADYPNTFGVVKQGFKFLYNKITKIMDLIHPSGTTVQIDKDGNLIINLNKDLSLTVTGKISQTAKGDITFSSDGNLTLSGKGGVSITSDGTAELIGKGGTTVGDSSSMTGVDGSLVNLAGGGLGVALLTGTVMGTGNLGGPVVSQIIEGSSKVMAPK